MSADNWAVCPRCAEVREAAILAADAAVAKAYGAVPVEVWDEMRAAADALGATEPEQTFREDYEFYGVEDGVLQISYSGGCKECGLSHRFEHSESIGVTQ